MATVFADAKIRKIHHFDRNKVSARARIFRPGPCSLNSATVLILGAPVDEATVYRLWIEELGGTGGCVSRVVEIVLRRPPSGLIWA